MRGTSARSSARRGAFRPLRHATSRARRARAGAEACGRLLRLARACVAAAYDVVEASRDEAARREAAPSRVDVLQRLAAAEAIGEALVATLEATAAVARASRSNTRASALVRLVRAAVEGAATAVRLSSSLDPAADPDPDSET